MALVRVKNPGDLVMFKGEVARVVGIADGRTLTLDFIERDGCPTCGEVV